MLAFTPTLLITLPFYPFIAIAIKIDSKGPTFYTQSRVGHNGSTFNIIKFRTMVTNHNFSSFVTIKNDPRITSSGKFLRRYKIDEWPTIINVVKSEMSFVGPRPEAPKYVALYTKQQKKVLLAKPGITDPATISYNNEADLMQGTNDFEKIYVEQILPQKLSLNSKYIENQTFISDVKIIARTILLVLKI